MSNEQTTDSQSVDISKIAGNAPDYLKEMLGDPKSFFANRVPGISGPIFCQSIFEKLKIVEIGVVKKVEEASKDEGRVIVEVDVTEGMFLCEGRRCHRTPVLTWDLFCLQDMLNPAGSMHGGCAAALIDMCVYLSPSQSFLLAISVCGKPRARGTGPGTVTEFHILTAFTRCSTLALYAHVMSASDEQYISVSQTMNIIYHSPALL